MAKLKRSPYFFQILILLLSLWRPAAAQNKSLWISGADLSYQYQGNGYYQVKLNLYTHCSSQPDSLYLTISPLNRQDFTPYNIFPQVQDLGDATFFCEGQGPKTDYCSLDDNDFFNVRRWQATALFKPDTKQFCEFLISYQGGLRSFHITTGSAGQPFYIDALLRTCDRSGISSGEFAHKPYFISGVNQCQNKSNAVTDKVGGGAQYQFDLVEPKQSADKGIDYNGTLSYQMPLAIAGGKQAQLTDSLTCDGFHLNPETGNLFFKPVEEAISPVAIRLTKTINGKTVSYITRDMLLNATALPDNNSPIIYVQDKVSIFHAPVSEVSTLDIRAFDVDPADTVLLTALQLPEFAKFQIQDPTKKWPKGILTLDPQSFHVRPDPYIVRVRAQDNNRLICEESVFPGEAETILYIYVDGTTGVQKTGANNSLVLFPNPASTYTSLQGLAAMPAGLRVVDIQGKTHESYFTWDGARLNLEVQSLPAGLYLLEMTVQGKPLQMKMQVVH